MLNKPIHTVLSLVALLILGFFGITLLANLAQLAAFVDRALPGAERIVFWGLLLIFAVLLVAPLVLYFRLPKALVPPEDDTEEALARYRAAVITQLRQNPLLTGIRIETDEELAAAFASLGKAAEQVVKETASAVFVSTAVMQNGRLDGLLVLAGQLRMLWRIASIYYQRPSPRQTLYLYSNVGANVLIADNIQDIDFAELATPIVVSVFPSMKGGIPGLQGISTLLVNSLANGAANAFLTLRVGLLAKAYCEALTMPSSKAVRQSTTAKALGLVATIVKEQGRRVANKSWETVRDSVASATDATIQGAKDVVSRTSERTFEGAKTIGKKMTSGLGSVKGRLIKKEGDKQ